MDHPDRNLLSPLPKLLVAQLRVERSLLNRTGYQVMSGKLDAIAPPHLQAVVQRERM